MWRIAADTGGTFTDAYAVTPDGVELRCKVLSTARLRVRLTEAVAARRWVVSGLPPMPRDFYRGFRAASLAEDAAAITVTGWDAPSQTLEFDKPSDALSPGVLLDLFTDEEAPILAARLLTATPLTRDFPPMELRLATTRATNALLESKGSPIALFITAGFGDLPRIGDQRRPDLFALRHEPRPVFSSVVAEVPERLAPDGSVLTPLDVEAVTSLAKSAVNQGIRHAAVALLHSYANPAHEQRVGELLQRAGFTHVSLSSALSPFAKILPRMQSALANAYLTGPVEAFVKGIASSLKTNAILRIMTPAAWSRPRR
jgi:5-oxoprolinase (ATP-hydrolysing)